jgi:hypothetical protein
LKAGLQGFGVQTLRSRITPSASNLFPVLQQGGVRVPARPAIQGDQWNAAMGGAIRTLRLRDDWQSGDAAVGVAWQLLTQAAVTVEWRRILLRQAGQSLTLDLETSSRFDIEVQDVSRARAPQDSDNPGLQRIVVRMQTPAATAGWLTVLAQPGKPWRWVRQ